MEQPYYPVVVHYSVNPLQNTSNTKFVSSFSYIEEHQDVAWFNNRQYTKIFGIKRSLDQKNKLLAILRLEYKSRTIRRRYMSDNSVGLHDNRVGLTSESIRILFDDLQDVSKEVIKISKGNIWDIVLFYWNHPFHSTRISTRIGLPSLIFGVISLFISIYSLLN